MNPDPSAPPPDAAAAEPLPPEATGEAASVNPAVAAMRARMRPKSDAPTEEFVPAAVRPVSPPPPRFDFRQPSFLAPAALRQLRRQHDDYARLLSARLSTYLRIEFGVKTSALETVTSDQLLKSLANPTYIGLFKLEPLGGICLFVVPPAVAMAIVDRLLGGPAQIVPIDRELTEIEVALLEQSITIVLSEWCRQWQATQELRPVLLGHETQPQFVKIATPDTAFLKVTLEAGIGECRESLLLCFPCATVEPLFHHLGELAVPVPAAAAAGPRPVGWDRRFDDLPVRLAAGWQELNMPLQRLAALRAGDVLLLPPSLMNEVQISIESVAKFRGRLGRRGDTWAVEIAGPAVPVKPSPIP